MPWVPVIDDRRSIRIVGAEHRDIAGERLALAALEVVAAIGVDARAGIGGRGQELAARFGVAFGKAVHARGARRHAFT